MEAFSWGAVYFVFGAVVGALVHWLDCALLAGERRFAVMVDGRCLLASLLNGTVYVLCAASAPVPFALSPRLALHLFLSSVLLLQSLIDYDCQLLPDALTLLVLGGGTLYAFLYGAGAEAAAAAAAVALAFYLLYRCSGGLGLGDVKLAGALVLWLDGWEQAALFLVLAFGIGGICGLLLLLSGRKRRGDPVAFGPFLALAAVTTLLYGTQLCRWYGALFLSGV